MTERRRILRPRTALVLVILLMTVANIVLVHWHDDWAAQGCELCHARHTSVVHSPFKGCLAAPVSSERSWLADQTNSELEQVFVLQFGRAPPPISVFTV